MRTATAEESAEHIIRPAKLISAGCIDAKYTGLQIIIHKLWKALMSVKELRERRIVGYRIVLVLSWALIDRIELIIFHTYIYIPRLPCVWNTYLGDTFQERWGMGLSAKHTKEQVEEIIEDAQKTDKGGREVQEQVEGGQNVLHPDNSSSVVSTFLNSINQ